MLTLDHIRPALQTSKQMSKRYVWMDTTEIVDNLLNLTSKGEPVFELRQIQAKRARKPNGAGRGVHLVRLRTNKSFHVDGETLFPEIVIKNSYDGSCPLVVEMGIFRLVCSNGLIIKSKDLGSIKIRHTGTPLEVAYDIVKGIASRLPKMLAVQRQLAETSLTDIQIVEFAKRAAKIRWDNIAEDADVTEFITAIRPEDNGNSVWKIMNVVQEKLMNGGVKMSGMRRTGRQVKNANEDLRINQELFELAMEYAQSSGGELVDIEEMV